jgi:hypothetical protein
MHPGMIVHLDNTDVLVSGVVNATKKKTDATLMPDITLPGDLKIALRMTGLDGQEAEIADAFVTSTEGVVQPVSFINDVQPILSASCATSGCHSATTSAAGLNLSSSAYSRIVNVSSSQMSTLFLIKPMDPDNSYLLRKIKGTGINGSQMPRGSSPLAVEVITVIENWIRQGALNN